MCTCGICKLYLRDNYCRITTIHEKKSSKLRTVVTIKYEIEQNCIQVEKNLHRKKNCTNSQKNMFGIIIHLPVMLFRLQIFFVFMFLLLWFVT